MNIFISEARKNKNVFPSDQLSKKIIYNYQPILTNSDSYFQQVYLFDESTLTNDLHDKKIVNIKQEEIWLICILLLELNSKTNYILSN